MNNYIIYTRGVCDPITKEGRWAAVVTNEDKILKQINGKNANTNKNRMELVAIANSLSLFKSAKERKSIIILSDSQFVTFSILRGLYKKWASNGWKSNKGNPVWNSDVWEYITNLIQMHDIDIRWLQDFSQTDVSSLTDYLTTK